MTMKVILVRWVKAPNASITTLYSPLSCSVASYIPEYKTSECFDSRGDPREVVNQMLEYLQKVTKAAYDLLKSIFVNIYTQIEELNVPNIV